MEGIGLAKAAQLVDLSVRQLSYWKSKGFFIPSEVTKYGSKYFLKDIITLYLISSFLKAGITIHCAMTLKEEFIKLISDAALVVDEALTVYVDAQFFLYIVKGSFYTSKPAEQFKCIITFQGIIKAWLEVILFKEV